VKKVKSESDSTVCQRAPRLLASPSFITSQFQSLVVSLSDIAETCSCCIYTTCGT